MSESLSVSFSHLGEAVWRADSLASAAGVTPVMPGIPQAVEISSRVAPDGKRYIFLLNSLSRPVEMPISGTFHDLLQDREHQGTMTLPPHGFVVGEYRPQKK